VRFLVSLLVVLLAGCAREELLHGLDESQANEALVALGDGGIQASKAREDGADGGWMIRVSAADAAQAHRLLSDRALPRPRPPGFTEVFAKGSMVPTPTEEHALYQHALAGELARSVEAIDGVVGARVHLGLPQPDPLRPGAQPAARAAVLVRCRPAACAAVRGLEGGIRALVTGAAEGLEASQVSVVIAEAAEIAPAGALRGGGRAGVLVALAAMAGLGAVGFAAAGLRGRARAWVRARLRAAP
jgi:type III secretion protein J